jgi:hypothetical protein
MAGGMAAGPAGTAATAGMAAGADGMAATPAGAVVGAADIGAPLRWSAPDTSLVPSALRAFILAPMANTAGQTELACRQRFDIHGLGGRS